MVLGFDESTVAYDLQRAHSADIWLIQMRFWFWSSCAVISALLIGNIMGVFDINIMGWLFRRGGDFIDWLGHWSYN
jgi:hypothetical protein|tara:strand:- start:493 stop:720 length:228 start_codon:yes stop_codon:yes gene_type:complete